MLRAAFMILSGNAFASVLLLARTLIVAWLIPVEDFGIAATFAVSMAVVEMLSALGLQQQIVQAKDGNDPRLQAGLQGFQLLRGLLSGGVLFLLAGPIARFLGVPEVLWAYQLLALVPVMNGLVHFDIYRKNRTMVYLPGILTVAVPALASVLVLWPLATLFGDWRVMLYAIMTQGMVTMITSHLVAERPYRLIFDRRIMAHSLGFGWPLLANGVLLFLVFNGEKLIVGRELGMAELAIFSMGVTLTLTPTLVMANSTQAFFLPQLSSARSEDARFAHLSVVTMQAILAMGLALAVAAALAGGPVAHLLLGAKYADLLPLVVWLALMQAIRVFKAGCAIVALSLGHTGNAMAGNLVRVLSLPIGWYVAVSGGGLQAIIWTGILGEVAGYCAVMAMLRWRAGVRTGRMRLPLAAATGLLGLIAAHAATSASAASGAFPALWAAGLMLGALAVTIWLMKDLRQYISRRTATPFSE